MARQSRWSNSKRTSTREYLKNREYVMKRDYAMCMRCYYQYGLITNTNICDHFINQAKGGGDDINNLWCLCDECHKEKTQQESNGRSGFYVVIGPDGWPIQDRDWQAIIIARNEEYRQHGSCKITLNYKGNNNSNDNK